MSGATCGIVVPEPVLIESTPHITALHTGYACCKCRCLRPEAWIVISIAPTASCRCRPSTLSEEFLPQCSNALRIYRCAEIGLTAPLGLSSPIRKALAATIAEGKAFAYCFPLSSGWSSAFRRSMLTCSAATKIEDVAPSFGFCAAMRSQPSSTDAKVFRSLSSKQLFSAVMYFSDTEAVAARLFLGEFQSLERDFSGKDAHDGRPLSASYSVT